MALAIDIKAKVAEEPRISARSWQQNPMGAAFTIDAPLPVSYTHLTLPTICSV